jgi:DNA-directed RNA polymerase subunit F
VQVFHKLEVLVQEPITLAESKEIMSEVDRNRELQVFTFSMVEVPK